MATRSLAFIYFESAEEEPEAVAEAEAEEADAEDDVAATRGGRDGGPMGRDGPAAVDEEEEEGAPPEGPAWGGGRKISENSARFVDHSPSLCDTPIIVCERL